MSKSSKLMIGFGLFLIGCGFLGWAAAGFTAKAKTAILSGGMSGLMMIAMGFMATSSRPIPAAVGRNGGLALPVFFTAVFSWRAMVGWQAYAAGQPWTQRASFTLPESPVKGLELVRGGCRTSFGSPNTARATSSGRIGGATA